MKNILLAGSSGLVGSLALKNLLADSDVGKIILVSRTKQDISNDKILQIIGSLDLLDTVNLSDYGIEHIDAGLCALGSTIKKAGGKEAFKKVDKDFVENVAIFAKKFGAKQFAVISALGADPKSSIFYNQVKGEMEEGLKKLNFSKLTIIRPSLILGERKEVRSAERFFIKISPFLNASLIGPLKKYRGIEAKKVASYLSGSVHKKTSGVIILENAQLLNL